MSRRNDEWVARFVREKNAESEQCTAEVTVTYPAPQQHAQRTSHLDWHRGYRAALRELARDWAARAAK